MLLSDANEFPESGVLRKFSFHSTHAAVPPPEHQLPQKVIRVSRFKVSKFQSSTFTFSCMLNVFEVEMEVGTRFNEIEIMVLN